MSRLHARPGRYTRPFKRGKYYYYCTYDEYGIRHRFSTGEKTRTAAEDECERRKDLGILMYTWEPKQKPKTLAEYGTDFWNYETCPLIQDKIQRGGKFSRKLSRTYQGYFNNHIRDVLGDKSLADITKQDIRSWLLQLPKRKKISNKSANNVLGCLRSMLSQAVDDGLIDRNLALDVKPLIENRGRRGAFTMEQISLLFSSPWENRYAYIACSLSARTGMRVGEIRALTTGQIFPDHVLVNASWADGGEGRKCTKSGFDRAVPITDEIFDLLKEIMPPRPGLLFTQDGVKPLCTNWFSRSLRKRMDQLNGRAPDPDKGTEGLPFDYKNKKQPLSFHSFRHFLNTRLLAADMPMEKIQAIIGHESDEMTEHYAHLELEDLKIFREVQARISG